MPDNEQTVDEKNYDSQAVKRSVVDNPSLQDNESPRAHPLILSVSAAAQRVTPWGTRPKQRDKELRSLWITEPWLASVVYLVSIRNASFAWEVVGSDSSKPTPRNTSRKVQQILKNANRGKGWQDLIIKTCIDLYTTDGGAYWEIIRTRNSPNAPVINIAHLDSLRCQKTGDPQYPVIYTDRRGKEHVLRHWQVRTIEEFPSPVESAFGLQYSAVSRVLLAAEIIESIATYKHEKVSGTFTRAIDVVSGVTRQNIDDGIALAKEQNLNRGLYRYSLPVIIPGVDPTSSLSHIHLDIASLPDNFDEDVSFKWYVAQLAAAFGVDYQEIAPLMTGNLGSSQQSEIMHLKTRGKGPALIMNTFEDIINGGLIPGNVEFRFLEQDLRGESEKAEARFTRSKERAMRVKSGELDGRAARQIAVMDGDLPEWLLEEINQREEELGIDLAQPEPGREEMGANQIAGGIETQEEKASRITMDDINRIRQRLSVDPFSILEELEDGTPDD